VTGAPRPGPSRRGSARTAPCWGSRRSRSAARACAAAPPPRSSAASAPPAAQASATSPAGETLSLAFAWVQRRRGMEWKAVRRWGFFSFFFFFGRKEVFRFLTSLFCLKALRGMFQKLSSTVQYSTFSEIFVATYLLASGVLY
jgi:hypothetical protein